MQSATEPRDEEQFTAFIDFLGFSEASTRTDDTARLKILDLLLSLSALRGEFAVQSTVLENGRTSTINPAISTFSDHIVISYPLEPIAEDMNFDEHTTAFIILMQFNQLLSRIAAAALSIGFLVRGGATIGKLYHARGVVFGEALVDAFQIESRTSVYPRVVLSSKITQRRMWTENQSEIVKDGDGLYHFDYFKMLALSSATPGEHYNTHMKAWFEGAISIVGRNLAELETSGRLNELAKWSWFAREFRSGLERLNPQALTAFGISLDAIPWAR